MLSVYTLKWSDFISGLSNTLILFILATSVMSLLIGLLLKKHIVKSNTKVEPNLKMIRSFFIFSFIFIVIECLAARNIPLLSSFDGEGYSYKDFGLPIIHVLLVNFVSFASIYSFHCYRSITSNNKERKKIMKYIMLFFSIFILILNRGALINCFIAFVIIYLVTSTEFKKSLIKTILSGFAVLFIFGILGNLRTDTKTAKNIILEIGQATDEFRDSHIPDSFFWGYLYIASPITNLQYNISQIENSDLDKASFLDFFILEICPEIISKRVSEHFGITRPINKLKKENFNVSTVYSTSYTLLGWFGMVLMYIFTIIFIIINIILVKKTNPFYITQVAMLCSIIILNIFDNMFIEMGSVPMLIFPIIFNFKYRLGSKTKKLT